MILKKPFYLMRHAETEANLKKIACGTLDSKLTEQGQQQAKMAAMIIGNIPHQFKVIYHSNLSRSKETAKIINASGKYETIELADLCEHRFGEWEGLEWNEVFERLEKNTNPPGGESREEFMMRTVNAFNQILNHHDDSDPPLIVAHGGTFFSLGRIYQHSVVDVGNCHLYFFSPTFLQQNRFPWETWHLTHSDGNYMTQKKIIYSSHHQMSH